MSAGSASLCPKMQLWQVEATPLAVALKSEALPCLQISGHAEDRSMCARSGLRPLACLYRLTLHYYYCFYPWGC